MAEEKVQKRLAPKIGKPYELPSESYHRQMGADMRDFEGLISGYDAEGPDFGADFLKKHPLLGE